MKRLDPALVTVLSTGWGIEADDPRLVGFDLRLEKPFRKSEVEDVIHRALEQRKEKPRRFTARGGAFRSQVTEEWNSVQSSRLFRFTASIIDPSSVTPAAAKISVRVSSAWL